MIKRIRYIFLLIFLMACALVTQAQVTLPEQVCVGTTQRYWVNGLPGSVYTWKVDGVVQSSTSNEINIQWINAGIFTLEVQEHQGNCDGEIQTGQITVTDLAIPEFTVANEYCAGSVIAALPNISNNSITGTWTPAINNIESTIYTFTPDDDQCAVSITHTIQINDRVTPQFVEIGPYCAGEVIPALPTVSINDITGTWSPEINNTTTTTYTFTPDDSQCATTEVLTITINNPVVPTFEAIAPVCSGTPFTLPTASTEGITGTWSPEINNTATTTYTFTPDASYPCAATAELIISIIERVEPVFAQVGAYCSGAEITALPAISSNDITGTWNPAINSTQTSTYTFTPDDSQCATTASMTITINEPVIPTFDQVTSVCRDAEINLPVASLEGITGTWSPVINNRETTTYTFTPDAGQCAATAQLTIVIDQSITPTFAAVGPYCTGDDIPALPTVSIEGITGTWEPAINNTETTTYTFTPDHGQCAIRARLDIEIQESVTPTFEPVVPSCAGSVIAELPTTSTNGITGTWSPAINNTATTTYTFTPDAGYPCSTTAELTITITDGITPTFEAIAAICSGSPALTLPTTSQNGITGNWSPAFNNTATTEYTFTPDEGQCATTTTLTVVVNEQVTPTFDPVSPVCRGEAIAALPTTSLNGITGTWSPAIDNTQTTTYTFTPDDEQCAIPVELTITITDEIVPLFVQVEPYCAGSTIEALPTTSDNGITGTWSPAINNTQTTEYTFTPDAGQCGTTATLTITISDEITPTFDPVSPVCRGEAIATLPTTSSNGITGSWSPAINNTQTTEYTFTPDAGQCGTTATLTITISDEITPTFNPVGPVCRGEAIAALPTTSLNGITGSWSPAINNTQTTEYTFTPDAGQCGEEVTMTIVIEESIAPIFAQVGPYCLGTTIDALPTTSTNGITGSWSPAIDNTQTTEYTFTPDAGQCGEEVTMTIVIDESIAPIFAQVGPYCLGATIDALPTTSTNGITGSWSPAIDNTQTTEYTFTPDAGQCGEEVTMTITISDEIIPIFDPVGPFNAGSAIAALPTVSNNGIIGTWSPAIDNTQTTTYTFTPDAGQCATTATLTIVITSEEITPVFDPIAALCEGSEITLPTVSTNGITGTWSPAINNTQTTTYTFTPDAGQNATITTLTVEITDEITPTFDPVGPFNAGSAIAALPTVSNNGIIGTWSPAIDNTVTTTYTFTPDAGQCATTATLTIVITSEEITPVFDPIAALCEGSEITLPTVSTNGITGTWSPAVDNTQTTTYTFTPDAGQNATITTLTVEITDEVTPTFDPVGPFNSGSTIAALPTVSNNGIIGTWSPAIDNTVTTTYTFTPDAGQCATTATLTIVITTEEIIPVFDPIAALCEGSEITLPTTSNNGITGTWSPAVDNTRTTTYTFTPDAGQNATITTLTVEITDEVTPTFDPVGPFNAGSAIAALPTVSNNGISGTWSPAIDNTVTTDYIFTPDAGQCATTATLTIVITSEEITPVFDPIGPLCEGSEITLPTTSNNGITGTWSPAINNTQTTTYTFTPEAGQNATTANLTIVIDQSIEPVFALITTYCLGSDIPALPTVSDNGIIGTWSPAIDNTQTTTYTFTPDAGQCAVEAEVTITISDEITPAFDPVGPICRGQSLALPLVSTNGITGFWSPAVDNTQTTTYTFTPNEGQCGTTATLTVTVEESITPIFDPVGPFCSGSDIPALSTISINGIQGTWSPAINNNQTTVYTFNPDNNECTATVSLTIVIEESITPTFSAVGPYCIGSDIPALPVTSNNGISGTWSPEINNTETTTYTFTPDDSRCTTNATLTIVIDESITPTFDEVGTICRGAAISLPSTSNNGIRGSWSPAINTTETTTYTFTPDAGQCGVSTTMTINVTDEITPTFDQVGPYCPGEEIAELPTTSNNDIHGRWTPAINNTQTTTYTFIPDAGQCGATTTMTIVIDQSITPTFNSVGPYCQGSDIPELPTTSLNGIAGSWSPDIDNSETTTYTFTPDEGQCGGQATLTIVITDEITPSFDPVAPICRGGAISLPAISREGIRGTWSPAIDNTETTTYTFTPNDSQCAGNGSLTVEVTESITPDFDAVGPYCLGSDIPDLPTTSENDITGSWSPAINNTQTTTYTFTPDAGQCGEITTLTIVVDESILPTFDAVDPYCEGSEIDELPTTSNNDIHGSWSPDIDNSRTTTYTFTPDDGQCGATTTLTIVVNPRVIPSFDAVESYCPGSDIASLPTTSNNGIHGSWSPDIDNTQTTTYTFTPDDEECAESSTMIVVIEQGIVPEFTAVGPYCPGADIPALPTTSNNGIHGSWSPDIDNSETTTYTFTPDDESCAETVTLTIEIDQDITPSFDPVGPFCPGTAYTLPLVSREGIEGTWSPEVNTAETTTYTFTPNEGECGATATLTVAIQDNITPSFEPMGPYCSGDYFTLPLASVEGIAGTWSPDIDNTETTTYTFTPQGGDCSSTASLTIEINEAGTPEFDDVRSYCAGADIPDLPTTSNNGMHGSWSPEINNTATTTYTFTPDNECASTATLIVVVEESIVPSFDPAGPYCQGSNIDDLPTSSSNGVSGTWSPDIDNMQTTTYTFTPDDGQCATTASLTIVIEQGITPTFDPVGPYCLGGDIPELPTVSNNDIRGSWSPDINNLGTTVYTFTPDEGQCGATTTLTIAIRDNVTPEFNPVAPICSGASISLPGVSNNGIRGSWSPDIDNTQTTTYTFTPDEGQCATSATLTIEVDPILVPTFDPVASYCPGEDIPDLPTLSNNGIRGTWSPDINNDRTTVYTFTPDVDQCATAATLTIVIDQSITPLFDPFGSYCRGSEIAQLPTTSINNITGSWSPDINNVETTVYTFTPDDSQCAGEITAILTITDPITPDFDPVAPICSGAAISLPAVSTNGIRGSWSPALNNTQSTTYTFTPEDGQCSETVSLTVEVQQSITPTFDPIGPLCRGATITLPDESNEGITGTWRPAVNNMQTTTYTFTPDAGQCAVNATLTVEVGESATPVFSPVGPYCSGSDIDDLPTVSNNGITGTWSPDIDNTQTTTYTFTPDAGQCGTTTTLTITVSNEITPVFDPIGPVCSGTTFTLPVVSENGIRGSWSPEINNNATITYTFTPDEGQCGVPATLTVEVRESTLPTFEPIGPLCRGTVFTLPEASSEGITGRWSPAVNNTQSTTYTFVPYPGQCGETTTLTVEVQERVTPTFEPVGPFCPGEQIAALPTVSTNNITGSWSPAIDNTRTATYTFTPDAGQCATNARMTITIDQSITPTFERVGPYCTGAVIAELPTVSDNGIRGTWSPAINNMQTTTYTFTPDAGQCGTTATMTINISDEVTPTFAAVGPYCVGATIAALPTVSNNGIRGTWSPAIDNTQTTTYTFTPDAGQCGTETTLTISVGESITPVFAEVGPYCRGSVIAALPVVSTNGIRGTWSPAIDNTQTTTYTFTPNANQCSDNASLTIVVSDEVTPTFDPAGPYCEGTVIAALPTVSNNGIRGRWSPAINNTQTITYTFTPDAGQCGTTTTLVIEIEDRLTPTFNPVGPFNPGSVIAALPTTSTNGIRGTWSPAINNNETTTYTFTPNANECATPTTLTITISDLVIPAFDPVGPYCEGSVIAALPTTSNNGIRGTWSPAINNTQTTTYTFTPDAGQGGAIATMVIEIEDRVTPAFNPVGPFNPGSVIAALPTTSTNGIRGTWSPAINNNETTTYTFTPNANECATETTLIITISDLVIPAFDPVGPYCEGSVIAALPTTSNNGIRGTWSPAINNTQTTTYTFTPAAGQGGAIATMVIEIEDRVTPTFTPVGPYCPGAVIAALPIVSNNGIRGSWSPAINNTQTTTYTFTPNADQCAETTTLTIAIEEEIIPLFSAVGSICRGASITLPSVSNNGIRGSWRPDFNNTQTTTYTFTPDAGQCGITANMTIAVEEEVAATFDPIRPVCRGASVTLPAVSNNGIRGSWRPAINTTQTTTYTFTPTDGQCGRGATVTIVVEDGMVPTFDPIGPLCSGAAIVLPATSREGIPGRWRPAVNNTRTTTYTFTPESGQCAETTTMTIVINAPITPTFTPVGPYCPGSVIAALPTVSNNGIRGSWSPAINNQVTTTYTFTPEAGQCAASTTMTITISNEATPIFTPAGTYCPGSVIAALPTVSNNGIRGSWSPAINNQVTTTYTFTPEAGQCGTSTTLTINISDEVTPTFTAVGPYCPGSVIAALPTISNNNIRGSWSPAINNTQTTTYTFSPEAGQCGTTATMEIVILNELTPSFDPVGPFCPNTTIAALPTVSNNGIRGSWSPAINNQVTTTYTFTPDAGQCAVSTELTIGIGEDIVPRFVLIGPYCPGTILQALPQTSLNGITGSWSPRMNNMVTTEYIFTPHEGQCAVATTMVCEIGEEITPVFNAVGPYCMGTTIAALPTMSVNGVRGTWSPAIDNTQTTTYTFTPTDDQCALTAQLTITIVDEITPVFAAVRSYCQGEPIPALPTVSTNGVRGSWSPAINNTRTTTYTFTPDPGQCGVTTSLVIEVDEPVQPTFDAVDTHCPGDVIAALPTVSRNGIRGRWSPAINNTRTTTYTFTPDQGQCAVQTSMTIVIESTVVPLFEVVGPYCQGSEMAALPTTSTNGIRGTWSPAINTTQTTTYTFTPAAGQCALPATMIVAIDPVPDIPVARIEQPDCNTPSGTVEVVSPRGARYQYSLDGGNYQTSPVFTGLAPLSQHTITVREISAECESRPATVTINAMPLSPAIPVAELTVKPTCAGDGVVVVVDPAGPEYEFSMDGGAFQANPVFTNVAWGQHSIRVRNSANGCVSAAFTMSIPPVINDMDHDAIADELDSDVDGDGILNIHEGELTADSDGDGHMNYMDIDADNDGVTDHFEAQNLSDYLTASLTDADQDGVDDAYDISQGGMEIIPVDSEKDGTPDFLDLDSDNDNVPDYIEGHDEDANGKPDHYAFGKDSDEDGLDDGYDIMVNECMAKENALGSNAAMQDFDGDGLNDWRDDNDDDDEYLTKFEDLNADSDYSNDDMDFDGAPEYLDYGRECDLFIPDAFSPNGDNVHDYYQIYCINHYPDARLFIFDQLGNKIYEKAHYGNLAFWGTNDAAWWDGRPMRGPGYSRENLVPPGTYYYVLDLGNGEVKKSYVFVSY